MSYHNRVLAVMVAVTVLFLIGMVAMFALGSLWIAAISFSLIFALLAAILTLIYGFALDPMSVMTKVMGRYISGG